MPKCPGIRGPLREFGASILTTLLVLITTVVTLHTFHTQFRESSPVLFQSSSNQSTLSNAVTEETKISDDNRLLNHKLHPENHVYRDRKTWTYKWEVTTGIRAPDGVKKRVFLINGMFPGPVIEARSGDSISVEVANRLEGDEGLSIHWHGLHMRGANLMDGVVGYTQDPTPPNSTFVYTFDIDDWQSGTFWYHSHCGEQIADGLWGGLIIHKPEKVLDKRSYYDYDEELLLMIGDWYHHPAEEVFKKYLHWSSMGLEPVGDSLLVNGLGYFDCAALDKFFQHGRRECDEVDVPKLDLATDKKYRLRVVNTGALAGFSIGIPNAKMSVVQVDGGGMIQPSPEIESIGIIYPGERFDAIVTLSSSKTRDSEVHSLLRVSLDHENFLSPNIALRPTQEFPISLTSHDPNRSHIYTGRNHETRMPEPPPGAFDLSSALSLHPPSLSFPQTPAADKIFLVRAMIDTTILDKNRPLPTLNDTSYIPQSPPLVSLRPSEYDKHQLVPATGATPVWVDIVVNNRDIAGHPFHLHGHDFYVIQSCRKTLSKPYNPFLPNSYPSPCGEFELARPIRKDTVYIPGRGFVVLRFHADNRGLWMFHCHLLWHHAAGMAMGFRVLGE